jgi:hypothetical protein
MFRSSRTSGVYLYKKPKIPVKNVILQALTSDIKCKLHQEVHDHVISFYNICEISKHVVLLAGTQEASKWSTDPKTLDERNNQIPGYQLDRLTSFSLLLDIKNCYGISNNAHTCRPPMFKKQSKNWNLERRSVHQTWYGSLLRGRTSCESETR